MTYLRTQLEKARENLRLIREHKSEYVMQMQNHFPSEAARAFLSCRSRGTGVTFIKKEITAILRETWDHPAKLQRTAANLYDLKRETG